MKSLHVSAVVTALFLILFPPDALKAQEQAKPLRFDLTPFVGYRTIMSFPVEPHVTGINPRIVMEASPSYGVSFGMWTGEDDLVEFRWARQDSQVHSDDIEPPAARQSLVLNQFHGDFSHEYLVEDWATWARPFVMGSVGVTHGSGSNNLNFTRFSFGLGGGIRFYASRHIGFKIQAEWLPVVVDPQVAFICGAGCIVHVGAAVSSQGEVIVGPVFHF